MSDIISPDDLAGILAEHCKKYTDEVVKKIEDGIEKIGNEVVKDVKELSPEYDGSSKKISKGAYRRSWTCSIKKDRGKITATIHVRGKHYRLTHLLENGHLNRDGTTRSREFPHISIANEHAQEKVNKLLEDL